MFEFTDLTRDNVIAFKVEGKVAAKDYEKLTPLIKKLERENKPVRLFIRIVSIDGITPRAMLKDITAYIRHARHVERVAVVGEGDYAEGLWVRMADPFMKAKVKYFPLEEIETAENWIKQ